MRGSGRKSVLTGSCGRSGAAEWAQFTWRNGRTEEFEKQVALKILKRGTDTDEVLRRFRRERQILAQLAHPNIAHLLDAGTTEDGLPYFAMEYVPGIPVTDFCEAQNLTLRARLQLFLKICGAVEFAHRNLVVHRDLKPANILVTAEGEPKLLDFGIAKLLAPEAADVELTLQERQRLTPAYASPEQVRGEAVTTVSDVYALGALLYELLAGQTPHRFATPHPNETEMVRVIVDGALPAASSITQRRELRGDLDNILIAALRKEPERRYSGVTAFADDIHRFLEQRPVRARPDTAGYRMRRFLARNKVGVAAAALVMLALLAGSITTLWQARRAEQRFNEVRKIANSFLFEFHDSIKDVPGALAARQLVTRRALQYLDSLAAEAGHDLLLQSELATAYVKLGQITFDTEQGLASYRKAVELSEALVAAAPKESAYRQQLSESFASLANAMRVAGHSDQAIVYARKAVAAAESLARDLPSDLSLQDHLTHQYCALAFNLIDAGQARVATTIARQAVETQERVIAQAPSDQEALRTAQIAWGIASYAYEEAGDYETALAYSRRGLETTQTAAAAAPENARYRRDLWAVQLRTARQLAATGQPEAALEHYGTALGLIESLSSADPNDEGHRRWLAMTKTSLADLHAASDRFDAASQLYREAIAISEGLLAGDPDRIETQRDLTRMSHAFGLLLTKRGDLARAQEYLTKAAVMAEAAVRMDPTNTRVRSRFADVSAGLAACHVRLAEQTGITTETRATHLRAARHCYEQSDRLWQEVQRQGLLHAQDVAKPEAVAAARAAL